MLEVGLFCPDLVGGALWGTVAHDSFMACGVLSSGSWGREALGSEQPLCLVRLLGRLPVFTCNVVGSLLVHKSSPGGPRSMHWGHKSWPEVIGLPFSGVFGGTGILDPQRCSLSEPCGVRLSTLGPGGDQGLSRSTLPLIGRLA